MNMCRFLYALKDFFVLSLYRRWRQTNPFKTKIYTSQFLSEERKKFNSTLPVALRVLHTPALDPERPVFLFCGRPKGRNLILTLRGLVAFCPVDREIAI